MTVQDSAEQKTDFVYEAEILNTAGEEMEVQFGTDGRITWKDGFLSLAFGESGQNRPLRRVPLEKLENRASSAIHLPLSCLPTTARQCLPPGSTPMPQHRN